MTQYEQLRRQYSTLQDVIDYWVRPSLGEFVDRFDVDGIAREVAVWVDGAFEIRPEVDVWNADHYEPEAWAAVLVRNVKLDDESEDA